MDITAIIWRAVHPFNKKGEQLVKRKFLVSILIGLGFVLAACSDNPASVQRYLADEYGIQAEIIAEPVIDTGNMGKSAYEVRDLNDPSMIFKVYTDGLFFNKITGDNYEELLQIHHQLKDYPDSDVYQKGIEKGIHSFLSPSLSNENNEKPVISVVLLKDGAMGLSEENLIDLYEVYSDITDAYSDSFVVSGVEIADTDDFSITNTADYYDRIDLHQDRVPLGISGKVDYEQFKESFMVSGGEEAVVRHFYQKDQPIIESIEPELAALNFDTERELSYVKLSCQNYLDANGENILDLEAIDLNTCHEYMYALIYKAALTDGVTETEVSNFYKAIELLKSTDLNIAYVEVRFNEKEKHRNGDLRIGVQLNEINTLEDARQLLEDTAEENKEVGE